MNNQLTLEESDLDFNIEEVELVVAPDVSGGSGTDSITTSIVSVCRCS
jgi:hypothetical protein